MLFQYLEGFKNCSCVLYLAFAGEFPNDVPPERINVQIGIFLDNSLFPQYGLVSKINRRLSLVSCIDEHIAYILPGGRTYNDWNTFLYNTGFFGGNQG